MSRVFHLVRHGHHPLIGQKLCGRREGVTLDDEGVGQMRGIASAFRDRSVATLQCSPQPRARRSAEIVAEVLALDIEEVGAADELEFGEWSGLSFTSLDDDPRWRQWNEHRCSTRPPGGESMREVQQRLTAHLEALARSQETGAVLIVSHAEPIRAVVLGCLGLPLGRYAEIEVEPASISTIEVAGDRKRVLRINGRSDP